jgi:hypothetical protein
LKSTPSYQSEHSFIQVSDQFLQRQVRLNKAFEGQTVTRNIIDKDLSTSFVGELYSFVKILDVASLHYNWDGGQFSTLFLATFHRVEPNQSVKLWRNENPILVTHFIQLNHFLLDFR